MELRGEIRGLRERRLTDLPVLSIPRRIGIAVGCGVAGLAGLVVPFLLYGLYSDAHSALELPMAATAWTFGLDHFEANGYAWWPIVVGTVLLVVLSIAFGTVFAGVADRFLALRTIPETIGAGLVWGFVTWTFFWYMLLPIAREGAPFRATLDSSVFVAPIWVFVLGFTILGLVTSIVYTAARRS